MLFIGLVCVNFQCRIKLKNLKSQYRYVKDRIPNIDDLDLEDDEVVKELISKCQVRFTLCGVKPLDVGCFPEGTNIRGFNAVRLKR
jgi:hypothetical protein